MSRRGGRGRCRNCGGRLPDPAAEGAVEAAAAGGYVQCPACGGRRIRRDLPPEQRAAAQQQVERGTGDVVVLSRGDGTASYAGQRVRLLDPLGEIVPADPPVTATEPTVPFPAGTVAHVLSAWNVWGSPLRLGRNTRRDRTLRDELTRRGWPHARVLIHAADYGWFEPGVCVPDADEPAVLTLAARFEQQAVVRWTPTALQVLDPAGTVHHSTGWAWRPLTTRPCPVAGRADADRGTGCGNPGGPYTSRSIWAAAEWSRARRVALHTLGCDVCDGGARPIGREDR